jgi:glycerol-3-phosphate acyltransferase PlsX
MSVRIAIDCMGGDHGLAVTVPAAVSFLSHVPDVRLLLVGREAEVRAALAGFGGADLSRIEVRDAPEVVAMDEPPASALRSKRKSSMRLAIEAVKSGEARPASAPAILGQLMAISRSVWACSTASTVRPCAPRPTSGRCRPCSISAPRGLQPEHYLQFAIMGAALVSVLEGRDRPSVGLLNIGEEAIKGNDSVKQAAELLRASSLNFHGNVEGNDIYEGTTDVVVCDGFVGNVALKTSEGLARMLNGIIREEFSRNLLTKGAALLSMAVLKRLKDRVDHRRYNGASLVGLRGIVIKSHGSADAFAFEFALRRAYDAARNGLLERIAQTLPQLTAEAHAGATGMPPQPSEPPGAVR